ncbi:hypothetical protein KCP76_12930 [Salmonella enterica subsp. enterica serovar Weltevreden]|nr:hypothetical protein KCP76_12930 [Salmonella enterica subsp. enterica serovar Weltevreden]
MRFIPSGTTYLHVLAKADALRTSRCVRPRHRRWCYSREGLLLADCTLAVFKNSNQKADQIR